MAKNNNTDPADFHPNPEFYEEQDSAEIYSEDKRIGKVFGVRDKNKNEFLIRLLSKSKKPHGWKTNWGFNLYNILQLDKLFLGLRKVAKTLGWKFEENSENLEKLKQQIREQQEFIAGLQQVNIDAKLNYKNLLDEFKKQQVKLLKSRIDEFKQTIKQLKQKIIDADQEKIPESDLQEFLYKNTWLFGTEYINAEPQKLRGAHSKFDFYLERFNKTNDIVEIKLLSDSIVNADDTISAKVIQAVDQLIEYLESATAAAHSTVISQEESIRELRPRGIVIIGKDNSEKAKQKLQKWNYSLTHIKILTYQDIVDMGEVILGHLAR